MKTNNINYKMLLAVSVSESSVFPSLIRNTGKSFSTFTNIQLARAFVTSVSIIIVQCRSVASIPYRRKRDVPLKRR